MGAALYGAGISRQFKTKDIRVQTISPHSVSTSYNITKASSSPEEAEADIKTVTTTIFGVKSKLGAKKIIRMKKTEDFSVQFAYTNQPE